MIQVEVDDDLNTLEEDDDDHDLLDVQCQWHLMMQNEDVGLCSEELFGDSNQ